MNIDFFENIQKNIREKVKLIESEKDNRQNVEIDSEDVELQLATKLDAIEEFSVDRFEGDKVVLENRENGEILNVDKEDLPEGIKEGSILKKINGKYIFDGQKTKEIEEEIKNKINDLWN